MSRVSYQVAIDPGAPALPAARALDPGAIATRGRDAKVSFRTSLSKRQSRWLRNAGGRDGAGAGQDAIVRAMIDLAMELPVDWEGLRRPAEVRAAIRDAVLIRGR